MVEKDPVSSFLQRIIRDPTTNKLLIFISSIVLIISGSRNIRRQDWNFVPLIVIFISSFLYSALSIFVTIYKKEENVTNCEILKKIFRGRIVYWHEIQTACAVTLGAANISGLVLAGSTYEPLLQVLFSCLNIFLFSFEFDLAAKNGKQFVTEENPKLGHNCLDCIFGGFHAFPLFFNVIRKGCLIAALVLVVVNQDFGYSVTYFIYCTGFSIAGSFILFLLQTSGSLENAISTKLVSGRKWHTYLMLIVAIHAFLAVLTFSLVVDSRQIDRTSQYQRVYNYYNNDNYNNGYYNRGRYGNRETRTLAPPTPMTTWYTYHYTDWERFNAPLESPTAFILSCVTLLLSVIDLYARAIYSRSRSDTAVTTPLHIQGGINKVEDLPINIASPNTFENPNKQLYI